MSGPEERAAPGPAGAPSQVRPGWLLGALALLLLAALCCAYLSLCLLFVQGQWQLLYHPQQHAGPPATPSTRGLTYTALRFGPNEAGVTELSGWWIAAPADAALTGSTVLYLHDGTGSLQDTLPDLVRIHSLGCALFVFDYRGYGESAAGAPSEAKMLQDTRRAIDYLVETRHIAPASLVLWGRGFGATLAAEAASAFPSQTEARSFPIILEEVNPPALILLESDPRTSMLPVRLLSHDRLDATHALTQSRVAKLFLLGQVPSPPGAAGPDPSATSQEATTRLYTLAHEPKQLVYEHDDKAVLRFFNQAAHQ